MQLLLRSAVILFGAISQAHALVLNTTYGQIGLPHVTAAFGPQRGSYRVQGPLFASVDNIFGCYPQNPNETEGYVIMVMRGKCSFGKKARLAQEGRALGVIVAGEYSHEELFHMVLAHGEKDDITIPTVFVNGPSHLYIRHKMSQIENVILDERFDQIMIPKHSFTVIQFPMVFLVILIIAPPCIYAMLCLLLYGFRWIYRIISRRRFINFASKLPVVHFKGTDNQDGAKVELTCINEECVICMEELAENERIKVLPCRHGFHPECILPWFEKSGACPICRREYCQQRLSIVEECRTCFAFSSWIHGSYNILQQQRDETNLDDSDQNIELKDAKEMKKTVDAISVKNHRFDQENGSYSLAVVPPADDRNNTSDVNLDLVDEKCSVEIQN
eukprot:CAMPEP_0114517688 /NCGR_PEP_ID=MMETSP0109-20121206/18032_1 /TAXON_ID=29199 /ORGANISM="Chlorarachnion reptans, Strain CCCM449" /LENGTH=388 /DNA_ID=CAMNT_0001698235 /DNA_START=12 /DNA_END=1178 /DNA_ORIENTATION=+